jgi:prolyl 4-hydroxylase
MLVTDSLLADYRAMTDLSLIEDQSALAHLGAQVRKRLADHTEVYSVPNEKVELYAVGDFVTAEECKTLCRLIDETARPSELYDLERVPDFRTSYSGDLDFQHPSVSSLSHRIDRLIGVEAEIGEPLQGQRYHPGQQFKPHHDWFHTTEDYWSIEKARGGQRSWTAMIYLNTVENGGATYFTEVGLQFIPKPGVLLLWNNALADGCPNEATLHAGMPVVLGSKYVVTKWYRTRKWG